MVCERLIDFGNRYKGDFKNGKRKAKSEKIFGVKCFMFSSIFSGTFDLSVS